MDGLADDFMIDENGELVPVDHVEWEPVLQIKEHLQAHATVTLYASGAAVMRVYGSPSTEMLSALQTVMRGMMFSMTEH